MDFLLWAGCLTMGGGRVAVAMELADAGVFVETSESGR